MKLPAAGGWQACTLSTDGAYHLIDLGPSGEDLLESGDDGDVVLAVFRLIGVTSARWRHGGSSEDFTATAAEVAAFQHIFVPVDSSDQVSISINAGTIEFGGYWISSEAANSGTTEIDVSAGDSTSPTASGRDYDLNSIGGLPAAQSVAVFHLGSSSFSEQSIEIRANGASTVGTGQVDRRTAHSIISETDASGIVTIYTGGSDALWTAAITNVSAWITDNFIADSSPSEIVPSSFAAWVEMDDPDSDADDIAIILESTHTSNRTYVRGFRNTDESTDFEAGNFYTNYASFLAHLDGSQHTDMYLDDNRMHYWRRVSFQAPTGGASPQALTGAVRGLTIDSPAGAIAGSGAAPLTAAVLGLTITLPAGTIQVGAQNLTGAVLGLTLDTPVGAIAGSGAAPITGTALSLTVDTPAGAIAGSGAAPITGVALGVTIALPAGSIANSGGPQNLTGTPISITITVVQGSISGSGATTLTGTALSLTVAAPAGAISGTGSAPLTGVVLGATLALPAGTLAATGAAQITGTPLSLTAALPAGSIAGSGAAPLTGAPLSLLLTIISGSISAFAVYPSILTAEARFSITATGKARSASQTDANARYEPTAESAARYSPTATGKARRR